ncbi:hypothetical protein LXL04_028727 [Taraxacum kok-saghyz]
MTRQLPSTGGRYNNIDPEPSPFPNTDSRIPISENCRIFSANTITSIPDRSPSSTTTPLQQRPPICICECKSVSSDYRPEQMTHKFSRLKDGAIRLSEGKILTDMLKIAFWHPWYNSHLALKKVHGGKGKFKHRQIHLGASFIFQRDSSTPLNRWKIQIHRFLPIASLKQRFNIPPVHPRRLLLPPSTLTSSAHFPSPVSKTGTYFRQCFGTNIEPRSTMNYEVTIPTDNRISNNNFYIRSKLISIHIFTNISIRMPETKH